jgi:hypothetical protein
MKHMLAAVLLAGLVAVSCSRPTLGKPGTPAPAAYLGFDRNDYPGDNNMKLLRRTFSFAGYWLNNPPGATSNTWTGKRRKVEAMGFGFLVVFNGRSYKEIKANGDATKLGHADGQLAIESARREGFPAKTIIFLDQEEGGRLLAEQRAYLHAWADAVQAAGFRAGVYCSGIAFKEDAGETVITAEDIRQNAGGRHLAFWVTNDACPPSPGCGFPSKPPAPSASGVAFADVWQFAQSPRRPALTSACARTYNEDGDCIAPGGEAQRLHVDVNVAKTNDPSQGRTR